MSQHNETFDAVADKQPIACESRRRNDDEEEAADSRQDEPLAECVELMYMARDDGEDFVHLSPRFDPSYATGSIFHEGDNLSIQACVSSGDPIEFGSPSSTSSAFLKGFLRENSCPTMPPSNESLIKRDKPMAMLCRSMAWSQDSMDELRVAKRSKKEEPHRSLKDEFVFSGFHHRRKDSSPTMVHWEEKIAGPMDLTKAVQRAMTVSTKADFSSL
jgi:hypothetical protein